MVTSDRSWESNPFTVMMAAAAFPVFGWSVIQVLRQVPSWALRLTSWDLLGVIAYTQTIALMETIVLASIGGVLVLISSRLLKDLPSLEWVGWWVFVGALSVGGFYLLEGQPNIGKSVAGAISATGMVVIAVPGSLLLMNKRWRRAFHAVVQRFSLLAYFYLLIGGISFAIVLIRNF